MKTFTYEVKDPLGLHARVAGKLVNAAMKYECEISVSGPAGDADVKRIMSVMRMGASKGENLTFTCEGPDEEAAASGLMAFLQENL